MRKLKAAGYNHGSIMGRSVFVRIIDEDGLALLFAKRMVKPTCWPGWLEVDFKE